MTDPVDDHSDVNRQAAHTASDPGSSFGEHLQAEDRNQVDAQAAARQVAAMTAAEQERDEALDERDQLRYERRLLGAARMVLARVAESGLVAPSLMAGIRDEAADMAQRIVDEIAHPVIMSLPDAPVGTATVDTALAAVDGIAASRARYDALFPEEAAERRAHAQGYAEAVARLRDDDRYTNWWMSGGAEPTGLVRQHLADYLETVGPDGVDVETGRWPAREQAVIRAAIAWRVGTGLPGHSLDDQERALVEAVDALPHIGEPQPEQPTKAPWPSAEEAALLWHNTYEKHLHPDARLPSSEVPEPVRAVMIATAEKMLDFLRQRMGGIPAPKLAQGGTVFSVIASSNRFASAAAGHPAGRDWVRLRTGSGRQYEGERSPACPGDGQPGHWHDIRCVRRNPAPKLAQGERDAGSRP